MRVALGIGLYYVDRALLLVIVLAWGVAWITLILVTAPTGWSAILEPTLYRHAEWFEQRRHAINGRLLAICRKSYQTHG